MGASQVGLRENWEVKAAKQLTPAPRVGHLPTPSVPHHLFPFLGSDPRVKGPLEEFQWRQGRHSLEFLLHCVTTSLVSHPNPAPPRQPLVLEGTSSLSMEGHLSPRAFWKGRRQKDVEGGIVARRNWGRGLTPSRPTDTPRHQHAYTRIHTFYFLFITWQHTGKTYPPCTTFTHWLSFWTCKCDG